jgi:hypothetical protein
MFAPNKLSASGRKAAIALTADLRANRERLELAAPLVRAGSAFERADKQLPANSVRTVATPTKCVAVASR